MLTSVRFFVTPWISARQASLSITNSRSLPKLMSIESVMPSSHLILCCPLLLLPPIPPSIRVFSNESTLHMRWPKAWSFSFSISPSSEHPGLVSFRMDWLDLLAVQGTLKSLLQHYSSKASILRPNLPVTPGVSWLSTFAFQSPIMKRTSNTSNFLYLKLQESFDYAPLWKQKIPNYSWIFFQWNMTGDMRSLRLTQKGKGNLQSPS